MGNLSQMLTVPCHAIINYYLQRRTDQYYSGESEDLFYCDGIGYLNVPMNRLPFQSYLSLVLSFLSCNAKKSHYKVLLERCRLNSGYRESEVN